MKQPIDPTISNAQLSSDEFAIREVEAFFGATDPAKVEAAMWHTRREQVLSPQEETDFQQWLTTSSSHRDAYEYIDSSLKNLQVLDMRAFAGAPASSPTIHPKQATAPRTSWYKRFRYLVWSSGMGALALSCLCLIGIGLGVMHWLDDRGFEQSFIVKRGERLDVSLPDGSQLALDSGTVVNVSLRANRREIRLDNGRAMFSVAHDGNRPFIVLAGAARVTVVGTRFSVSYDDNRASSSAVEVAVEQGHVKVGNTSTDVSQAEADLLPGQMVHVSATGEVGTVATIDLASIALWRKGMLHFSNTSLAVALKEFERYGPTHVFVRDPVVAAMPVGGSYRLANPAAFAQAMPRILPVRLVYAENGDIEIVRSP